MKKSWGGKRQGAGRKQELKGRTTVGLVLDDKSVAALDRYSGRHECSRSEAARTLIKAGSKSRR